MSIFVAPSRAHSPGHTRIPQVDNRTCREHDVTALPPISISRQHRACVTRPSALYCCGCSSCVHRSLRSVIHHLYLSLLLGVTDSRSLWTEMQGSFGINITTSISDVLCFFPETHPRNLDIRQHAENANNIITPPSSTSSSEPHHDRVAGPRCTAVVSCSIGGYDPPSAITASLFAVLCMCVRCIARLARDAKNKDMDLW